MEPAPCCVELVLVARIARANRLALPVAQSLERAAIAIERLHRTSI
jgi:hypothetical protein